MLPDTAAAVIVIVISSRLNAPTGAWCSLTWQAALLRVAFSLNAPTGAWCSLTWQAALLRVAFSLNAPTGAWCSLTQLSEQEIREIGLSQCTYRCVVLPDPRASLLLSSVQVSMHLQVRGAP